MLTGAATQLKRLLRGVSRHVKWERVESNDGLLLVVKVSACLGGKYSNGRGNCEKDRGEAHGGCNLDV